MPCIPLRVLGEGMEKLCRPSLGVEVRCRGIQCRIFRKEGVCSVDSTVARESPRKLADLVIPFCDSFFTGRCGVSGLLAFVDSGLLDWILCHLVDTPHLCTVNKLQVTMSEAERLVEKWMTGTVIDEIAVTTTSSGHLTCDSGGSYNNMFSSQPLPKPMHPDTLPGLGRDLGSRRQFISHAAPQPRRSQLLSVGFVLGSVLILQSSH